jgi:hypothetical protein
LRINDQPVRIREIERTAEPSVYKLRCNLPTRAGGQTPTIAVTVRVDGQSATAFRSYPGKTPPSGDGGPAKGGASRQVVAAATLTVLGLMLLALVGLLLARRFFPGRRPDGKASSAAAAPMRAGDEKLILHLDEAGRPAGSPCPKCGQLVPGPPGRRVCPVDQVQF